MMSPEQQHLYDRIVAFDLDDPHAAFPFSQKLAKENGWTLAYTRRAIVEYKRFAFLAMISPQPVSPSEQVDQVWHMHMTYTQSYWDEFCGKVLGRPFHHYPSKGGAGEFQKYVDLYEATLALYEQTFGEKPPADIWSDSTTRFSADLQVERINTQQHWVIEKAQARRTALNSTLVLVLMLVVVGCTPVLTGFVNPFDLDGPDFLNLYVTLLAAACLVAVGLRWGYLSRASAEQLPTLNEYELAYLTGKSPRVADVALVTLIERGEVMQVPGRDRFITQKPLSRSVHPVERAVYETIDAATPTNIVNEETGGMSLDEIQQAVASEAQHAQVNVANILLAMKRRGYVVQVPGTDRYIADPMITPTSNTPERIVYQALPRGVLITDATVGVRINQMRQAVTLPADALREQLEHLRLIADSGENWVRSTFPRLILLALLLFGGVKVFIGISRERPVAYLIILCIVTLVLALFFGRRLHRSKLADRLIHRLQVDWKAAKTAPDFGQEPIAQWQTVFGMGLALNGPSVLANSPYTGLRNILYPPSAASSGDGGGADGGGGCGGGCGGCGGCGG